jgi:hypothetical protein
MGKLLSGIVIGLVIGLGVGAAAGYWAHGRPAAQAADPWLPAGLAWQRLPGHADAGPLPQTFAIPPTAYDYGAASLPIGPMLKAQPTLLRIEAQATAGSVGVFLSSPDGTRQLSNEKPLTPKDGRTAIYFRTSPTTPPAVVVVRNYNRPDTAGAATVYAASYAPLSALGPEALAAVNAAGIN